MHVPLDPADYSAALAATVRHRREAAGLSQNQLSITSGVSRTMLTHVERGMRFPTVDFLCRLARGLKTTPARILAQAERELKKTVPPSVSARFVRHRDMAARQQD
jgi:transcriptional regulator with XRE-family HTH domain